MQLGSAVVHIPAPVHRIRNMRHGASARHFAPATFMRGCACMSAIAKPRFQAGLSQARPALLHLVSGGDGCLGIFPGDSALRC